MFTVAVKLKGVGNPPPSEVGGQAWLRGCEEHCLKLIWDLLVSTKLDHTGQAVQRHFACFFLCVKILECFLDDVLSTFNQDGDEEMTNECRFFWVNFTFTISSKEFS